MFSQLCLDFFSVRLQYLIRSTTVFHKLAFRLLFMYRLSFAVLHRNCPCVVCVIQYHIRSFQRKLFMCCLMFPVTHHVLSSVTVQVLYGFISTSSGSFVSHCSPLFHFSVTYHMSHSSTFNLPFELCGTSAGSFVGNLLCTM